jgi:PilZ domain-containing protein
MENKRLANRHRMLKPGTIKFGADAVNCMVRNMSNNGAALDVNSPERIPEHFTLVLQGAGDLISCHVVWRNEKRIGVTID